ncbi:hypothetical protein CPC08DRAFT_709402 [Agrocybe pediades]|nr:hypothetical protein CPC08DRAFT_709402 [Agrocybe pediades]
MFQASQNLEHVLPVDNEKANFIATFIKLRTQGCRREHSEALRPEPTIHRVLSREHKKLNKNQRRRERNRLRRRKAENDAKFQKELEEFREELRSEVKAVHDRYQHFKNELKDIQGGLTSCKGELKQIKERTKDLEETVKHNFEMQQTANMILKIGIAELANILDVDLTTPSAPPSRQVKHLW